MNVQSTLSGPKLPAIFPVDKSRQGKRSPASAADKLALLRYGHYHRLSQAEMARIAGVTPGAISQWKRQVGADRGTTGNKLDNNLLRLVQPTAAELKTKGELYWLEKQEAEGLTDEVVAELAKVQPWTVKGWRKRHGYSETRRNGPSELTTEDRIALLELQRDEGLTNAEAAEMAGVHIETITAWRKELGFAGERGGRRKRSEAEQREWLAKIDGGEMTTAEVAKELGVSGGAIYQWRATLKRKDEMAMVKAAQEAPAPAPEVVEPIADGPEVGPAMILEPARRLVSMTRPDGVRIEVELTLDEIAALFKN